MSKPAAAAIPRSTIFATTIHAHSVEERCDPQKFQKILQEAVQAEAAEARTLKAAGIADASAAYDLIHDGGAEKIRQGIGRIMAHGGYWTLIGGLPLASFGEGEVTQRMNAAFGPSLWPTFFTLPLADHPASARVRIAAAFIGKADEIKAEVSAAERAQVAKPAAHRLQQSAPAVAVSKPSVRCVPVDHLAHYESLPAGKDRQDYAAKHFTAIRRAAALRSTQR